MPNPALAVVGTRPLTSSPSPTEVDASGELARQALGKAMELCQVFPSCLRSEQKMLQSRCVPPGFSSPPPSPSCSLFTAAHLAAPLPGRRSPHRRPCPRVPSPPSLAEGEKQKLLGSTNSFNFLPRFLLAAERLRCCLGLASWGAPQVHQNAWLSHLLFPKGCDLTVGIMQQS